ncbi:hypothetical protein DFJ43DRAFT_1129118 [Lentinula guzmanii]|uniref:Trypsin-like serine protease n=1 Tax=Lentinula guzmanii TaxID=2804957 RepID=A0AA38MXU7_9AGAR|nr:hypothetical protein DFJ43DRAFT_1129118 [Lentinula guzmanii]
MLRTFRFTWLLPRPITRQYATVSQSPVDLGGPPVPEGAALDLTPSIPSPLDRQILKVASCSESPSLSELVHSYLSNSRHILNSSLLYESRPSALRKVNRGPSTANSPDVLLIAHCVQDGDEHKITVASGFALEAPSQREGESLILSCAHTLEEADSSNGSNFHSSSTSRRVNSGSFVISSEGNMYPVTDIVSSLPRSDLMIMTCKNPGVATLPVSPYPVHAGTPVLGHFRNLDGAWVGDSWSKWVRGTVLGYRDFAGRETQPGTYDALSHLLFSPLPTAGSSGGPIIDEETGAVIGVMLGTRMDNRVEGTRGWGIPSETIFEMFSLPGLEGKK